MYGDINLVIDKESSSSGKSKLKKFRTISYIILFLITITSILLFVLNIRYSVNSVMQKQASVKSNLSQYSESAVKLIFLNLRLADIKIIVSGRTNYQDTLESFINVLPEGVNVDTFGIESSKFTITVSSGSLLSLNEYLNSVLKIADDQGIADVQLNSLSADGTNYIMALGMTLDL